MDFKKIAVFGGVYNNYIALEALIADVKKRGADELFCLGDLGAFGPNPDKVFPLLMENSIQVMQGNYDNSIGNGLADCRCGYTDPRDNHFAKLSYDYTFANTSDKYKQWMRYLPKEFKIHLGKYRVRMAHGSPRRMNEFLWESTTPDQFLGKLFRDYESDIILATHTGIHWQRHLEEDKHFVNVGVIGRPENNGQVNVWYTMLSIARDQELQVESIPLGYDYKSLAMEMEYEKLPKEFTDTVLTGWWTTCLEILPAKERKRGKY